MDKYTKVKVLGKGSFGSATLIKRKTDGALFVVKEVNIAKMSTKEQNEARNEVKILSKLSHPNIVRFVEHVEKKGILYIIMEYADGGDLHQKIKAQKNTRMKEATILHYFVQIALALDYLHNKHILHRDIKSMNVFLTSKGTVKLGDFGISTVLRNTMGMANTVCGTPFYFSPELCKNQPYNNKSDVWALGVLLYEMSALRHPFDGTSMNQLMQHIVRSPYPPLPLTFSASLRSLVASCLEKDHGKRPTVRALLNVDVVQVAMMQLGEDLAAAAEQKTRLQNIVANREEPSSSDASKQPSPTGPNPQPPPSVMPAKPVLPHHPLPITPPPRQPNDRPAELNPLVRPPLGAAANGVDPRRMPPPPPAAFVQAPHVVQHGAGALHGVPPVVPKPPVAAVPQGYVDQMRNVADFINDLKKPMHVILIEKEREAAQRRAAEDLARREAERKLREREQQIERDRRARAAAAAAKEREEQKKREVQQKDRERHLAELRRVMEEHDKRAKLQAQAKREAAAKESPRIDVPVGRGRPEAKPAAAQPHADRTPSPQVVKMGHDDVAKPAPGVKPAAFYNPQTPPAPSQPSAPRPTVAVLEDNRPAVSNAELARMAAMQERHQAVVKKAQNWVEREAERKKAFAEARRAEDERAVRDMDRHANLPRQQVPPVNLQPPAAPPQIAHGRRRSQDPSIEAAIMAPANITPPPAQLSQPLKHGVVDPDLDNWVRNDRARRDALESPVHPVGRRSEALRRSVDEADRVLRQQGVPALAPQPSVGGAFNVQFAGRNPPYIPPMRSVTPPPSPSRPIEFAARPRIQRSPQAARNEGNMGRAALSDDDRSMLAQPSKGVLNPAAVQVAAPRRLLPDLGNEAAARRRSSTSDEAAAGAAAALPKPLSIWERRHGSSNDNSPNAPNKESTPESSRSTEAPSLGVETQTSEGRSRPAHLSHTRPPLGPRDKSAPPVMSPVRANASKKIAAESPGKEMVATVSYHEVPERSAVEERIRSRRAKTSSTEFPADDDNDDEDALFEAEVEEDAVIEAQRSDDGKVDAERLAEYEAMRTHIQSLIAASPRARAMLRQPTEEPVDETDEWGDEDDGPTFGDETPMSPGTENFFVPEERMFRLGHMCGDGFTGAAPVFLDGRLLLSSGGTAGTVAQAHHAKAGPTAQPGVHAEMLRSLLENAMGFECLVAAYRHLSTVEEDKTGDAASDGVDAQEHVEVARDMIEQELRRRRGVEEGQDDEVGLLDDVQQYLAFLCQLVYFDEEVNRRQ